MIRFDNLSKRYTGGFEALRNVSFEMDRGEMAFLTGHSGAGKSTLLKLLMLIERPTAGNLLINGKNLNRLAKSRIPFYRRQLGVVFQNHQLLFDRSVFENVALPLQVSGYSPGEIGRRVRAALDSVAARQRKAEPDRTLLAVNSSGSVLPELWCTSQKYSWPMSRQVILIHSYPLKLWRCLERFQDVGVTVLVATHDINLINKMNMRIMRLNQGELELDGVAHDID